MTSMQKLFAVAIVSVIGLVPSFKAAAERAAAPESPRLVLNEGRKWTTDAAMRIGMNAIRERVVAFRMAHERGVLPRTHYAVLGISIRRELSDILESSELDARASRNFEAIVDELVAAADTLEGLDGAVPASGIAHAERVLTQYSRFFEHPGFAA